MSFYVYYGKLDSELLVAILPHGTVEAQDTIYLSSKTNLLSYKVNSVTSTDDGEDCINFLERDYTYQLVSKQNYKELNLIRTDGKKQKTTTTLTRKYASDEADIQASTKPKIWTGAFDFHHWAKNEEIVVIAPQGMGNNKPIVCIWQWTQDAEGKKETLNHDVSKQVSETDRPNKFSFKQNNYYTLTCEVNSVTGGLKLAIKGPKDAGAFNSEISQKELTSAKVDISAEHSYMPPISQAPKTVSLGCFEPMAKPSLERIAKPLPFPADLIESLQYSAAYVDQAGYLAKYAISQFEKLDGSYHKLEKRLEAKTTRVAKLEKDNSDLQGEKKSLETKNQELDKQLKQAREDAQKREKELLGKLNDANASKEKAKLENERLLAYIKELKEYIEADTLADLERERKFNEHDAADEAEILRAHAELLAANQIIADLKKEVGEKEQTIAGLEADLEVAKDQLATAEVAIRKLSAELSSEKELVAELRLELDLVKHQLSHAEDEVKFLRNENGTLAVDIAAALQKIAELERQIVELKEKVKGLEQKLASAVAANEESQRQLGKANTNLKIAKQELADSKSDVISSNAELERVQNDLKDATGDAQQARKDRDAIKAELRQQKIDSQKKYDTLKEAYDAADLHHEVEHHGAVPTPIPQVTEPLKTDIVVQSTEVHV